MQGADRAVFDHELPIDEGPGIAFANQNSRYMVLAGRKVGRETGADRGVPRIRSGEDQSGGVGDHGFNRLDPGIKASGPIENVENLPRVLAENRFDQRRRQSVEISVGEIAELALLRGNEPRQHAL